MPENSFRDKLRASILKKIQDLQEKDEKALMKDIARRIHNQSQSDFEL